VAELVFVLSDFFSAAPPDSADGLPRLPLLELMLARAQPTPLASDWRGWLAARGARVGERPATPATTVAAAWDALPPAAQQVWLATPVHYFAGLDSVHLHPAGLLRLTRDEQQRLAADFAHVFADSPWLLKGLGQRELLLWGPAVAASGADPAVFAGSDPSGGLPRGAGAATLRALGSEMELWLYEHPLNLERRRRGELPVTTFWLWGAEPMAAAAVRSAPAPARLYGRDTYAEALWRLQGDAAQELPAAFDAALISPHRDSVFLHSLLQPQGLSAALLQLEQRWWPGALQALRRRRVSGLWLLFGARAYRLRWLDLARFWRRRAAWWECLA